ncbi:MAG: hypothetical protein KAJ54_01470 [Candidatus Aenigmarchaeota archaeon]|nr:hypothetical protein [Candidatus Aenigmarchaeota archaeon]MCK5322083.1 hypothetical protein [Candidatus Aenigmarchaeota archaeon]
MSKLLEENDKIVEISKYDPEIEIKSKCLEERGWHFDRFENESAIFIRRGNPVFEINKNLKYQVLCLVFVTALIVGVMLALIT